MLASFRLKERNGRNMTANDVLKRVDERVPNAYMRGEKLEWLSELENRIRSEVFLVPAGEALTESRSDDPLILPSPHDAMYVLWLTYMIADSNGEQSRAYTVGERFNEAWLLYAGEIAREYRPVYGKRKKLATLSEGEATATLVLPPQAIVTVFGAASDSASGKAAVVDKDGHRIAAFDTASVRSEAYPIYMTGGAARELVFERQNVQGRVTLYGTVLVRGGVEDADGIL